MRRGVFISLRIAAILTIVIVTIILWIDSPMAYIKRKTHFQCLLLASERYSFDAIDHGKDYDAFHIFSLSHIDQDRFKQYVSDHHQWNLLPLDNAVLTNRISSIKYNPYMNEMLNVRIGYWFFKDDHELYIYDSSTGILYMRTASCITDYQWKCE